MYISGQISYIRMLNGLFQALVTVFGESCLRDELSYQDKLKTHLRM